MLFLIEQAFVGRDEKRAPLKTPAWEAMYAPEVNPIILLRENMRKPRIDQYND